MIWRLLTDKRFFLAASLLAGIVIHFWTTSRYPDLEGKAAMAPETDLVGLGFDEVFELGSVGQPPLTKVFYATANWVESNKKGMTFGVLAAAAVMTMMQLVPRKSTGHWFGDTVLGAVIGAPLGVCVNCAAPIAKGMQAGGTRPQTALATMLSSPTYNVIILTLMFSMLPWYFGVIKLIFSTLIIFVAIPLVVRFFVTDKDERSVETGGGSCEIDSIEPSPGWGGSIVWLIKNYWKQFRFIFIRTVPLMFLAGFIGAVLITFFPWRELTNVTPWKSAILAVFGLMLFLAILGTLLPSPIAFDVVIVSILLFWGMQEPYAMILLFTLGLYSVYAQMIVTQMYNAKTGFAILAVVVVMAFPAALSAYGFKKYDENHRYQLLQEKFAELQKAPYTPSVVTSPLPASEGEIFEKLKPHRSEWTPVTNLDLPDGIRVESRPFAQANPVQGNKLFTKTNGPEMGIDVTPHLDMDDFVFRFSTQIRSIAGADVHNDGWDDIIISLDNAEGGLALFANIGGKRFLRQPVNLGNLSEEMCHPISTVDLNNDGWIDLCFSTHYQGLYYLENKEGSFMKSEPIKIFDPGPGRVDSMTFGDLDGNGLLDAALGIYVLGWESGTKSGSAQPKAAKNVVLMQPSTGNFKPKILSGPPGITYTTLISDFDQNGTLDLITGDDFHSPDVYYLGDGKGKLTAVTKSDGLLPTTPFFTMSVATADVDNDLNFEIFSAQLTEGDDVREFRTRYSILVDKLSEHASNERERDVAERSRDYQNASLAIQRKKQPMAIALFGDDSKDKWGTLRSSYFNLVRTNEANWINWEPFKPDGPQWFTEGLDRISVELEKVSESERAEWLPQKTRKNTLFVRQTDGTWIDLAEERNLDVTAWTWNAKFADLDNDGWIDLYTANGWPRSRYRDNNAFFQNNREGGFSLKTTEVGLDDFFVTYGFCYTDFDRDGDLDVISAPANGEVRVFENQVNGDSQSIMIEIRDLQKNRFGVGTKISILSEAGQQIREIQSGGGYQSFDPYSANFGLGKTSEVKEIRVNRPGEAQILLKGPFESGTAYRITRE